ncbi:MAG: aminodeoxychorismate synthase component I [Hyphomicrobiales bacterium]|nr:aminodeoxychorismate synthase component I [Hyphomicrobiales bacterium]
MCLILLDNSLEPGGASRVFADPETVVEAYAADEVAGALERIEKAVAQGLYAAGYFAYEFGHAFEPKLARFLPARSTEPLLWFGLFRRCETLDAVGVDAWLAARATGGYILGEVTPRIRREAYKQRLRTALDYIAAGDIYQLNFTFKADFEIQGDVVALYRDLRARQKTPYGALILSPGRSILSFSPELFLAVERGVVTTRPMKGTAARGLHAEDDSRLSAWLSSDEKSRAENLMIVDLMRNDLGRIAETGSVAVPDLFTVETYQTVLQMTSTVTAHLRDGVGLSALARALLPPGSITGAPKVRAMEIIRELEAGPRGVYTGAIGMIEPRGDCAFNVAIRTLVIGNDGRGEIGVGSGVVQDSDPSAEYDECLLKMRFLTAPAPMFDLIETLRWDPDAGFWLLDGHLARMRASARHFFYPFDEAAAHAALNAHVHGFGEPRRVRATLNRRGEIAVASTPLPSVPQTALRFAIAETRMRSSNLFLYHKTTNRRFYDDERARLQTLLGVDEAVFLNERGELTEGSFTNLFIEKGGRLLTPARSCGLLGGVLRAELLDRRLACEAVLTLRDLADADAIWLGNSVRGLIRAEPADAFILLASGYAPRPKGRTPAVAPMV